MADKRGDINKISYVDVERPEVDTRYFFAVTSKLERKLNWNSSHSSGRFFARFRLFGLGMGGGEMVPVTLSFGGSFDGCVGFYRGDFF